MIPQCKGKDFSAIPAKKLENEYYASTKYDGNYVQVHYSACQNIRFYTSGGKEFTHPILAAQLRGIIPTDLATLVLECEFLGHSEGKLGDRRYSSVLTTYRTNFTKGLDHPGSHNDRLVIFDIISDEVFAKRLKILDRLDVAANVTKVDYTLLTMGSIQVLMQSKVSEGWEGLYLKSPTHLQLAGKRVANAIKLKSRYTADLVCIGTVLGTGKYAGMIGSLILQDSKKRVVNVGSGLDDYGRMLSPKHYIGKTVEIAYEQLLATYIQPTFICIREDLC